MENILYIISRDYDSFSRMHKKLSDFILQNYDRSILMSINELSDESGVSEATIVRFTYRLGFNGYREFQKALLDSIKYSITTTERLKTQKNLSEVEQIHAQKNNDINNINSTFINLDPNIILNAAKLIDDSDKIYILGLRTSNIVAQYFSHYMKMMNFEVVMVEGTQMDPYEQLISMTDKDVLICMSFPRYSKRTIKSARLVSERGYKIISLTDSESSPINKFSDITLIARNSMTSFFDSLVSPIALINSLLLSLSNITKKDVKKTFSQLEEYFEKADTYEKI